MILIGRNGRELCLWEDERAKVFRLRSVFCPLVDVDNVETRLVAVHGIQYDLHNKKRWLGKNATVSDCFYEVEPSSTRDSHL